MLRIPRRAVRAAPFARDARCSGDTVASAAARATMQSYVRPVITGRYTSPAVSRYACMITAVSVAWHALREPSVTHPAAPSFRRTPRSPVIIHAATVFPSPGLIAKITLGIRREGIGSGASQKRRDGGAHASLSLSLSLPPSRAAPSRVCELARSRGGSKSIGSKSIGDIRVAEKKEN